MKKVTVYTMDFCPYCERVKKLLQMRGINFEEKKVDMDDDAEWDRLEKLTGLKTMPQVFIGDKCYGGYTDIAQLDANGKLAELVK